MIAHLPPPPLPVAAPADPCVVRPPYKPDPECGEDWTYTLTVPVPLATAQPPPPPPPPIVRAAFVPEIAQATSALGWPHPWQSAEQGAVMHAVGVAFLRGRLGGVACTFPARVGSARCTVTVSVRGRVSAAYAVAVKAWEDGAIRMTRRRPS